MADREKVIKGLEYHLKELSVGKTCFECPYYGDNPCEIQLISNTIALLKEQKTGHWVFLTDCANIGVYCSECKTKVFDGHPFKKKLSYFCPHCGTRMEEEVERR